MSLQSSPVRREPGPEEQRWPGGGRSPVAHLNFWERHYASNLTKGGHDPVYVRNAAVGRGIFGMRIDEAAYQVWLYDHRP